MFTNKFKINLGVIYLIITIGLIYNERTCLMENKLLRDGPRPIAMLWNSNFINSLDNANAVSPAANVNYRGNVAHNGVFEVDFFPEDFRSKWKSTSINSSIHDASKASVVGMGEALYVGSDTGAFYEFNFNGQVVYRFHLDRTLRGIHSTAAIDDGQVYFGSYSGILYAVNRASRKLNWSRKMGDTIGGSIVALGTELIVTVEKASSPNGYLAKLNKNTGEVIWQTQYLGEQAHSTPAVDLETNTVAVGVNNSTVQGFDLTSGQKRWAFPSQGKVKSTIAIQGGRGFVTSWGKELICFSMSDGKVQWVTSLEASSQSSPVIVNRNLVFAVDSKGKSYGIDSTNGKILWNLFSPQKGLIMSPIALSLRSESLILSNCATDQLCMISTAGKVLKKVKLSGKFTGSPFVLNSTIYFSYDDGGVEAFEMVSHQR